MGGRGSLAPFGGGGGGRGEGADWDRSHPEAVSRSPKSLKDAVGSKGNPMSIRSAYEGANPYFDKSFSHREFNENCQRCVVAYELRRRGYNVIARPTFEGDTLPQHISGTGRGGASYSNSRWQGSFKGAKSKSLSSSTSQAARNKAIKQMQTWGPGSRAVLRGRWSRSRDGHVFNIENQRGKIVAVDAQTGKRYDPNTLLNGMSPKSITITRTDNLRISDRAKKAVQRKR